MSRFIYVEKLQELPWWTNDKWTRVYAGKLSKEEKYNIKEWIEGECNERVVVFGRTRWPEGHEEKWGKMIAGDGTVDVYFEDKDEATLFKLTWCPGEVPEEHEELIYR